MPTYDENGNVIGWDTNDSSQPISIPNWVEAAPVSASPAEIAAYRTARAAQHSVKQPVVDDRGHPFGAINPDRPSYIMEPDLQEAQGGMQLPPSITVDDAGYPRYIDTNERVPVVPRPGLLPLAATPEGIKLVMPKLLDVASNVMGNVGGKVTAKAGEMVLGSGMVRTAEEAKAAEPFYSQLERTVKQAKINLATPEQWLGYLKNQPGVKSEELTTVLGDLPKEGMLSKGQLEDIVKANKVELKETNLGVDKADPIIKQNYEEAKTHFENYSKNLAKKYDLNPEHNLAMYGKYKNMGKDEIEIYEMLQRKWLRAEEAYQKGQTKTQYHQYQLPGGENYKETLLSLPVKTSPKAQEAFDLTKRMNDGEFNSLNDAERKALFKKRDDLLKAARAEEGEAYKAPHFGEHGTNLVGHVRTNERYLPDPEGTDYRNKGIKGTHIEELQSDWAQNIRDKGFKGEKEKLAPEFDKIEAKLMATNDDKLLGLPTVKQVLAKAVEDGHITKQEANTYKRYTDIENATPAPDMPFKKNWDEVLIKRVIRDAVDKGHKFISVTPGEAQALRYQNEIRQKVNTIDWHNFKNGKPTSNGNKQVLIDAASGEMNLTVDKHGIITSGHPELKGKTLDEAIGKDIARQILEKPEGNIDAKGYVMGAEGMKGYYDKMVIDKFNNIGKKYGAKMEVNGANLGKETKQYRIEENPGNKNGKTVTIYSVRDDKNRLMSDFSSKEQANRYIENRKTEEAAKPSQPIHIMHITPALEKKAKEGFELFSSGPTLVPVDKAPDFEDKKSKKYNLIPIQGNPVF